MSNDTSFFFPHDFNASRDPKMVKLFREMGYEGTGLYWAIVEKIYEQGGKLTDDTDSLAFDLRIEQDKVKAVLSSFGLFKIKDGFVTSDAVDRRLKKINELREIARQKGIASGIARREKSWQENEPQLNSGSTPVEQRLNRGRTDREREREITDNNRNAPSAVDFAQVRLPKGFGAYGGAYVRNIPADECRFIIDRMRPGAKLRAALEWRIAEKQAESEGRSCGGGLQKPQGGLP